VIEQVITCDMCGAQKRQTNHWFVAREESGEMRIRGWNSLHLLSHGTKHLCGETCVHKLVSQFLMTLVDAGTQQSADKSHSRPDAKAKMADQTDCAEPAVSTWNGLPSSTGSSRSSQHAPREPEQLNRPQPCVGGRRS
jgi:hypothetical protein